MYKKTSGVEIATLKKNSINIEIQNIEGFVVKLDSLSYNMNHYYTMSKVLKTNCMRSGLHYRYFAYPKGNVCCIFTKLPSKFNHKLPTGTTSKDYIIVTFYETPEDFMASPLAHFYRQRKVGTEHTSNWDKFGYFTTDSYNYNRIPLVAATNKLCKNKVTKRNPPPPPPQVPNGLFLFLFG
ncbi:hypothetical protein GKZ90_0012605 [Flavobacterium sp. MC2016-06]|jgi:hypothetical protein|uniref:hypothetical protein n=1 Tax=Flavobacterium sp. MC2016-06 TaxID=2676308 RepID=UPI0012BB164D|nr:hypothetical protein [Flavobacterium sp. MC2016-06]MBU3860151.1 hypothetical protein [Flavobacterium sp. MC2016-06]